MYLRQLEYFLTIAEEGKITAAAAKLNMAQPPLSQQLQQLEQQVGTDLVIRNNKGIVLTDAGRRFAVQARQILEQVENLNTEMKDYAKGAKGLVNIGIISSSVETLCMLKLDKWKMENPHVHLNIIESDTFSVLDMLSKALIDVAFIRTPFSTNKLNVFTLFSEPVIAVARRDSNRPWFNAAPEGGQLKLTDLQNEDLILLQVYEGTLTPACRQAQFDPNIICRGSDAIAALLCARAGLGTMITPKSTVYMTDNSDLFVREIDCPQLVSSICMAWRKDYEYSDSVEKLLDHVRSQDNFTR